MRKTSVVFDLNIVNIVTVNNIAPLQIIQYSPAGSIAEKRQSFKFFQPVENLIKSQTAIVQQLQYLPFCPGKFFSSGISSAQRSKAVFAVNYLDRPQRLTFGEQAIELPACSAVKLELESGKINIYSRPAAGNMQ